MRAITTAAQVGVLLISLCILGVGAPRAAARALHSALDRVFPTLVSVTAYDGHKSKIAEEIGVIIGTNRVITHRQIFDGATQASIRFQDGRIAPVEEILADHFTADLALISVRTPRGIRAAPVRRDRALEGLHVSAVALDTALRPYVAACIVAGVRDRPGGVHLLQLDAALPPMARGGPVCSDAGEIAGIIVTFGRGTGECFAVDATQFDSLLPLASHPRSVDEWSRTALRRVTSDASDISQETGTMTGDTGVLGLLSDYQFSTGLALQEKHEWARALEHFTLAVRNWPTYADAWSHAAECALRCKRLRESILMYENAARLEPDERARWELVGATTMKVQWFDDSRDAWMAILEHNPNDAMAWENLGSVYGELHQDSAALDAFEHSLRIDPREFHAMFNRGQFYRMRRKDSLAERDLRAALAVAPGTIDAWESLGDLLVDARRFEDAVPVYKELTTRRPTNAKHWNRFGGLFVNLHRYPEAIEPLRHSIALDAEDPNPHSLLATALWTIGKFDESLDEWKSVIRIQPNDAFAHFAYGVGLIYWRHDKAGAQQEYEVLLHLNKDKAAKLQQELLK